MTKQIIYAIGSSVVIAPIPLLLKIFNPHTLYAPPGKITKELLIPAIKSKMNFYPDLNTALEQTLKNAKDYGEHDYFNEIPPVFSVEIECKNKNQFEVTKILEGYVIKTPKKDEVASKCEINISPEQVKEKKNSWFESSNINISKIICNRENFCGDFSVLLLRQTNQWRQKHKKLQAERLLAFFGEIKLDEKYLDEMSYIRTQKNI